MITFKQYLLEEPEDQDLSELLHRDCQRFITESEGDGVLFRGMADPGVRQGNVVINGVSTPFYKKQVRKDRKPLSMPAEIHHAIDDWFNSEFKLRVRSGAMFAFGSAGITDSTSYGNPAIVIPIGEFKYVWSRKIYDLYDQINTEIDIGRIIISSNREPNLDQLHDYLKNGRYQTTQLERAVQSNNEVMVVCDEYYVFPLHLKQRNEMIQFFKEAMK